MKNKSIPKLYVVFDTNVLYTQVASDLVRNDVSRIIKNNSAHLDLNISWFFPKVVIGERKYQMTEKAKELIPSMQKLEKLIGHKFGIGQDTLAMHVDKAIKESIAALNGKTLSLNTSEVDWENIIDSSINRKPPFEAKDKEKGFRDALIAQSFFQLINKSPSTSNLCRLAFISEDKILREHIEVNTSGNNNVRVLSNLDELESLINTLVSEIDESFVAELTNKAQKLFFIKDNHKTFYFKEKVGEKIKEKYSDELADTIIKGHIRTDKTWWIQAPIFKKKEKQRIYWVSTIEPEFEIFHFENTAIPPPPPPPEPLGSSSPSTAAVKNGLSLLSLGAIKVIDMEGKDKFEILWSTTLSQAHNLTAPKIEQIEYIGNSINS